MEFCSLSFEEASSPFRLYYRMNHIIQDNFDHSALQDTKNGLWIRRKLQLNISTSISFAQVLIILQAVKHTCKEPIYCFCTLHSIQAVRVHYKCPIWKIYVSVSTFRLQYYGGMTRNFPNFLLIIQSSLCQNSCAISIMVAILTPSLHVCA